MNKKVGLLLLASLMTITACSNGGGEIDYQGEKWNETLQSEMTSLLGEYIPYIELDPNYKHQIIESPSKDQTIIIYEDGVADKGLTDKYVKLLSKTKYVFDKTDTNGLFYNYYKDLGEDVSIKLRFGYYPGDESQGTSAGFEIYAYKEIPVVEVTSWSKEEEFLIKQNLGELFPCPHFTDRHSVIWDNELQAIAVVDYEMTTEQYDEYIARIKQEGYLPVGDGQTPFPTYDKPTQANPLYVISIDPYNHNVLGSVGVEIYVKRVKDVRESQAWPKGELDRRFGGDADIAAIPTYDYEGRYFYFYNKGTFNITVRDQVASNLEAYLQLLVENNYTFSYNSQLLTYVVINASQTVAIFITHTSDYQKITFEISKL